MNTLQTQDWYKQLLEDLKKIENGLLLTKWQTGQRICKDELKFNNPEYGSHRIENLAKDLKASASDLWACIRFYKKYLDGIQQLEGKSWMEVWHKYLPIHKKHKVLPKLPAGKYNIIYADPPWEYYMGGYKNQSQHYDTLSIDELKGMPMDDLAADNCILFLWVTFPVLDQVFDLIKWWGFNYSTVGFVWVKSNKSGQGYFTGLGYWTRSNAEVCLIATKGSIECKNHTISQIVYEPVGEHSAKPSIVRDKIIKLVGDLPRIELFAREKADGWDVWGNEI